MVKKILQLLFIAMMTALLPAALGKAVTGILPASVSKAREFEIHQIYLDNVIGDCYIFAAPDGKITLLDGGDSPQYKTCLRPALDRLGIRHIHQVIITHMHRDHSGSVIELLADKDISVDKILWQTDYDWNLIKKNDLRTFNAYQIHMRKLKNNAKSRGVPLVELKLTDVLDFGSGAKGKIIYGCDRNITANYINNQSLVFRFTYGDRSILFTGDMGFEEEAAILATGAVVKSDIYKAAHHSGGGSNSENFVRAVAPDFAIAPQPEFLYSMKPGIESGKRITNCGVKIFYAHEFRELCLKTDGKKFTVWNGDKEITVDDITK